jgi:hypothetical protein
MLISYEESRRVIDLPIGIAVCQWELDGEPRMWVLYPQADETVRIDFVSKKYGDIDIIKDPIEEWGPNDYGFGDNEKGYKFSKNIAHDIYKYWDGVGDFEMSHRIYKHFEPIFDNFKNDANTYLEKTTQDEYNAAVANAKDKGWDQGLVEKKNLNFPY